MRAITYHISDEVITNMIEPGALRAPVFIDSDTGWSKPAQGERRVIV